MWKYIKQTCARSCSVLQHWALQYLLCFNSACFGQHDFQEINATKALEVFSMLSHSKARCWGCSKAWLSMHCPWQCMVSLARARFGPRTHLNCNGSWAAQTRFCLPEGCARKATQSDILKRRHSLEDECSHSQPHLPLCWEAPPKRHLPRHAAASSGTSSLQICQQDASEGNLDVTQPKNWLKLASWINWAKTRFWSGHLRNWRDKGQGTWLTSINIQHEQSPPWSPCHEALILCLLCKFKCRTSRKSQLKLHKKLALKSPHIWSRVQGWCRNRHRHLSKHLWLVI